MVFARQVLAGMVKITPNMSSKDYLSFIQNQKPGPVGQVRDDRLCPLSNLFMVSGVRFQVSVKTNPES